MNERGSQRAARIAGCRLNPELLEGPLPQNASIRHAIEGDTAGETEVFPAGFGVHVTRHPQHDFFDHDLDRSGESISRW